MKPLELPAMSPKTLGHTGSDFEELSDEELGGSGLPRGKKGFGVPALYKAAYAYRDGLRPGDIILSLDGRWFESVKNFDNYIQAKTELGIEIEFLRNGKIHNLETKLHTDRDLQEECGTIEELEEKADFGEPYAILRARGLLRKTHWDLLGSDNFQAARKMAQANQQPLLIGLFGSSACCVHLAFWTEPYRDMITHDSIQKGISIYVSLLIMKPEAYRLYRQYRVNTSFPALLRMTNEGELETHLSLRPETKVSEVLSFLRNPVA